MNIQYYGDYCFKITTKPAGRATDDIVIWTDIPEKSTGIRTPFGHADIALLSHISPESDVLSGLKDEPVLFYTPGEYSSKGVGVLGYASSRDAEWGQKSGKNTIFVFDSEDVKLCFLGAIGHRLDEKTVEKIGDVDILFIPIGGGDTLSTKETDELIRDIEPKVVIPMHFKASGVSIDSDGPEAFCKEMGCSSGNAIPKFNFKKKDLDGKSMEIVFLERS